MHRLSDIDPVTRTGVCSECGPVALKATRTKAGNRSWRCKRMWRQHNPRGGGLKLPPKLGCCEECFMDHDDFRFFDQHHIDGDRTNNAEDNIRTLCPNCHREAELQKETNPA